jgi:hypothetical protein
MSDKNNIKNNADNDAFMGQRRVRSDAVLQNLPPEQQEEIARMLMPGPGNKTGEEVRKWLKKTGIVISRQTVSNFYRWWLERLEKRQIGKWVKAKSAQWAKEHPNATPAEVFAMGQRIFSRLAMELADTRAWCATQALQIRRDTLGLSRERFEFRAAQACLKDLPKLKAISKDSSLTEDEKIQRVRVALFGAAAAAL